MTPLELKRFVRGALAQLREENGHHDFEQLCHHIARVRISENVIPATGPVTARGDQGRDSESVPRVDERPGLDGLYGDLSSQTVVLCCTLQQRGVKAKILADVAAIRSRPELGADVIVAWTEASIPIGVRNEIRTECASTHNVTLHILDGNAIAELLACHDLNWLAHRYLDLPAEAAPAPRADEEDAWYLNQRLKWADQTPRHTWGDFEDLRRSLRHSYQHGLTADLPLWLELLAPFTEDDVPVEIRRSAVYETALAHLRGNADLRPVAAQLTWFFDTVADVKPSGALEDAQVLLTFCRGATRLGSRGVALEDVLRWREALTAHVEAEIADTDNGARLYTLLLIRGALEIVATSPPTFATIRVWWDRALDHADEATLVPIDRVSDRLPPLSPAFSDDPGFAEFTSRVDAVAASHGGEEVAGDLAVDRAVALLDADRLTAALIELHRAKVRFTKAHETSRLINIIAVIGETYRRLGLYWAAKQHFLAAASIAINSEEPSDRRYVALGLAEAAGCDYQTGAWMAFLDLARTATNAHALLDIDAGDLDAHPFLERLAYATGFVTAVALHRHGEFVAMAEALAEAHLPEELLVDLRTNPPAWVTDDGRYADTFSDRGYRPFDDAGHERTIVWTAHGIEWTLVVPSRPAGIMAAERVAATLQILQADLAHFDYAPLPGPIAVRISVREEPGVTESDAGSMFIVGLRGWQGGDHEQFEATTFETMKTAVTLLSNLSTLPSGEMMAEVHARFEGGILDKVVTFRCYDEMLSQWWTMEQSAPIQMPVPPPTPPPSHPELDWPSGPGPGYSREAAVEALKNRYRNLTAMTSQTLPTLTPRPDFQECITELRRRGWLDWHILGAVLAVANSYRMNRDLNAGRTTLEEAQRLRTGPEVEGDPVPLSEFTLDALTRAHELNNYTTLVKTWGRSVHLRMVAQAAVDRLLAERYGHYTDDIDHADPFN
jgi:tetratricopeptide (TPR) repeat protein